MISIVNLTPIGSQSLLYQGSVLTSRRRSPPRGGVSQSLLYQGSVLTAERLLMQRLVDVSIPSLSGLRSNSSGRAYIASGLRVSIPSLSGLRSNGQIVAVTRLQTFGSQSLLYQGSVLTSAGPTSSVRTRSQSLLYQGSVLTRGQM